MDWTVDGPKDRKWTSFQNRVPTYWGGHLITSGCDDAPSNAPLTSKVPSVSQVVHDGDLDMGEGTWLVLLPMPLD